MNKNLVEFLGVLADVTDSTRITDDKFDHMIDLFNDMSVEEQNKLLEISSILSVFIEEINSLDPEKGEVEYR